MGLEDKFPLLFSIQDPADLRALPEEALEAVTHELRSYLVETMARTGGHFAANLGTVELATALHYVFDTPHDRVVWDVGHQAYPHKILTGRRDRLATIRQLGGLAPFPTRFESEYDTFGVGHSSTSVSAALGMAIAAKQKGERRRAVAVIGDGALTAGLAYEALCHAGSLDVDLLVILNDNDMSISENVGAMSHYLARVLSGKLYSQIREGSKKLIRRMPTVWELARRSEEHVKGMVLPGTLFEELGLNYIGPVDGHDTDVLLKTLRNVRDLPGPQFLHVVTRKGKGYAPAEADPILWHGPGPFDPEKGEIHKAPSKGKTYSAIFGDWLCDMAESDPRVVGITPAMREGSGMVEYSRRFPERYFDVGICEQHAVTLGAGLACEAQLVGHLVHFADRDAMDIDHLGEATARRLVEHGLVTDLADLYALGAVGYFLVTGRNVFEGSGAVEICAKHISDAPVPLSERAGFSIPADFESVVLRCLEKDPGSRPSDAFVLIEELEACADAQGWTQADARAWTAGQPSATSRASPSAV